MARSGCIFGATGTFKTTAIAHMARYIAETTGKATLLFSADGGGWGPCQEEIDAGMIIPYHCDSSNIPLPIIRKVSQGFWPENPKEPDISKVNFKRVNWDRVGAYGVEGITSIGTMVMRHYADNNIKTGEESTSKFKQPILVDGVMTEEMFGMNSKGHFGGAHNTLYSMIMNFNSLPVEYVLFTGHEKKYAEDGELQAGVSVPGKAITPLVPTWLGDFIHAQDFKVVEKINLPDPMNPGKTREEEVIGVTCRYYFVKHVDPATGAIFEAKPRVTHSKVRALREIYPGGFFIPNEHHGFDDYLRAVDKLAQDAGQDKALVDWRKKQDEKLGRATKPRQEVPLTPEQIMAGDGKLPVSGSK